MQHPNLLAGKTLLQDDCHLFLGAKTHSGYGTLRVNGRTTYAHRYSYEIYNGPIPTGSVVHHTCATRACVNPAHLQAVTPYENCAEMLERTAFIRQIEMLTDELVKLRITVEELEAENDDLSDLVAEMREIIDEL